MIFFFLNWEKIIQGRKIKEKDRNPITKVIAAAGSWNAFNIHPEIIINDDPDANSYRINVNFQIKEYDTNDNVSIVLRRLK